MSAMPRLHRPQQSMLSGLGVAGAVLAAIVVTFTLASGIVAYSLTSDDPLTPSSDALVLDSPRSADLAKTPIVLRRADASGTRRGSSALAATTAGSAGNGLAHGSLTADRGRGGSDPGTRDRGTDLPAADAGDQPLPISGPPRRPVGEALGDTTQAVGVTTDSLTRRLQAVSTTLQPVSAGTREALRTTVGATTGALARLLAPPPPA